MKPVTPRTLNIVGSARESGNERGHRIGLHHRFHLGDKAWRHGTVNVVLPPPSQLLCDHHELAVAPALLVRRDAGLGDCLMILPTLEALKQKYPHLRILYQTPAAYSELVTGFEVVDQALPLGTTLPGETSDIVRVDLSNYMERHPLAWSTPRIDLVGTAFGIRPLAHATPYHPSAVQRQAAQQWLVREGCTSRPRLAIALRGVYTHRSWLVPYVFELAREFAAHHGDVLVFDMDPDAPRCGHAQEPDGVGAIASASGLPLPLVAALLAECAVAVVPDTGLLHLAACVRLPFVAMLGAVPPRLRLGHYESYRCLTAADTVSCVPCREGPLHLRCRHQCLRAITPAQVMAAVQELLAAPAETAQIHHQHCARPFIENSLLASAN